MDFLATLAHDLVAIDSRSSVSNLPVAARLAAALDGFETEALDYADPAGVAKRVLVAHRGGPGGLALSGHMDTVPDTGWTDDPFSGRIDAAGVLHGLGSADMKGPVAAAVVAARALPAALPITLLLTTDEETTKQGAREIVARSVLARRAAPRAIAVVEPTRLVPVRGHRSSVNFTVTATGVQAHSSTGAGRNANWALIPFLAEMKTIFERLRTDPALQDPAYAPPFGDFNLTIDNHGTAVNVTVPRATVRIKFRTSARIDPGPIAAAVHAAAARAGVAVEERREGPPPELPAEHPLIRLAAELAGQAPRTAAFGTDASELAALAPCVVIGPGDIAVAHRPGENVPLAELASAVPLFTRLAEGVAAGW
jgi:acetylornithine deacetylase